MSPVVSRVAIAGAGGMGREALAWLRDARPDLEAVSFFVEDAGERPTGVDVDLPLMTSIGELSEATIDGIVLGIGDGARRRKVADEVTVAGLALVTIVHPSAFLGPGVVVGDGVIVAPECVVTRDVLIGRGTILNYGAKVGHDCILDDFVFLGPGAILTGDVHACSGSTLGAGAVVLPGRTVEAAARVGAGAVVTRNVEARSVVAGVPAQVVRTRGESTLRASDSYDDALHSARDSESER